MITNGQTESEVVNARLRLGVTHLQTCSCRASTTRSTHHQSKFSDST